MLTIKELSIGISTFSELIQKNYVYVDKTALIHDLVCRKKYYFLNRPRRFGKSLLVSTFEAIFQGKKELFSDLAISSMPYDWQKHPVISLSFAGIPVQDIDTLEEKIQRYIQEIAGEYGIVLEQNSSGEMLRILVKKLFIINSVVLLIDEYDYPILEHIHDVQKAAKAREILKSLYSVIKDLDKYLRFVFFTGVSKFSNTSLFSGLNNLQDIGLKPEFNALLGYTADEIIHYFRSHVSQAAKKIGYSEGALLSEIEIWYDGYQFTKHKDVQKIYNPFSLLLFFDNKSFSNYWFKSGTPTFLINLLKTRNYPILELENIQATESDIEAFDIDTIPLKTLLYQTGYMTIKDYNSVTQTYTLAYPNREIIDSLIDYIFVSMTNQSSSYLNTVVADMRCAFQKNNFIQLRAALTQLYADVPYTIHIGEEKYYQTIFYLALKFVGAYIIVERATNIGRIDAVIQTDANVFIVEFKINTSAHVAIEQIKAKKYYQSYQSLHKKIVLVGIAFDTASKNISDILFEDFE